MRRRIVAAWRESWFGQPTGATNGRILVTSVVVAVLVVAVLWIGRNQSEAAETDAALAQYQAELSSWENARDENSRCIQRVDGREQLRGVFLSIFALIDEQAGGTSEFAPAAIALLESEYPPLDPADCPPIPPAPVPPG